MLLIHAVLLQASKLLNYHAALDHQIRRHTPNGQTRLKASLEPLILNIFKRFLTYSPENVCRFERKVAHHLESIDCLLKTSELFTLSLPSKEVM